MAEDPSFGRSDVEGKTRTKEHAKIRRWAARKGAKPARVRGTASDNDVGLLRIDFPGYRGEESLEPISWDEWFSKFDEMNLALLYQEDEEKPPDIVALAQNTDVRRVDRKSELGKRQVGKPVGRKRRSKPSLAVNARRSNMALVEPAWRAIPTVKVGKRLSKAAFAKMYKEYTHLASRATAVFGGEPEAARWLSTTNPDFDGLTPLQSLFKDGPGRVLDILGKIEHGVFF